jgi:hypothetical protein
MRSKENKNAWAECFKNTQAAFPDRDFNEHYIKEMFQSGWYYCKEEMLKILENKSINKESNDYKFIVEEIKRL